MKKTLFFALMMGSMLLAACKEQQEPSQSEQQEPGQSEENNQGSEQGSENLSVSGTLQGHDYVDLGLPSGTLWATCNVGANTPEEYGDYFAWGETTLKSNYEWSTYKYGTYNQLTKYCYKSDYGKNGFTDTKTTLDAEDDAATA
ncbi:MAG: hypothetical protein J5808_01395, partial [Paludibacteraceae bacterium]|nr:hypothetical protein [Paludibacteraceae bacterium]